MALIRTVRGAGTDGEAGALVAGWPGIRRRTAVLPIAAVAVAVWMVGRQWPLHPISPVSGIHLAGHLWVSIVLWAGVGLTAWWAGRNAAIACYAAALGVTLWRWGVPIDREIVMMWICVGLLAWGFGRPGLWRVVTDWVPFAAVLVAYDYTRGWARTLGIPIHWTPQIDVDLFLFRGTVPTEWLQAHLYSPQPHWWQVFTALCYLSHFIVPFVVAGVLWVRNRQRFLAWAGRFVSLSFLGLATYILFPAAPPWAAARVGYLENIHRCANQGLSLIGLRGAEHLVNKGQGTVNLYAAVPSLHAAYTMLLALFLWPVAPRWAKPLLVAYPLLMAFTLVFGGEHYVSDVLLGWAYAALVMVAWRSIDRWWAARKEMSLPDGGVPAGALPG